jgi:putative flippase GtrA
MRRLIRFQVVGALGFVLQVATIALLVDGGQVSYLGATAAGVSVAVVHNFVWHRRWTWQDRSGGAMSPWVAFVSFAAGNGIVSLAGNLLVMFLLVGVLSWRPAVASVVAIAACALANYVVADRLVFASSGRPSDRRDRWRHLRRGVVS